MKISGGFSFFILSAIVMLGVFGMTSMAQMTETTTTDEPIDGPMDEPMDGPMDGLMDGPPIIPMGPPRPYSISDLQPKIISVPCPPHLRLDRNGACRQEII